MSVIGGAPVCARSIVAFWNRIIGPTLKPSSTFHLSGTTALLAPLRGIDAASRCTRLPVGVLASATVK